MSETDQVDLLATALVSAQAEMGNAAFNKTNPHYKSKYADLTSIREATLPTLTKHGLCIIQYTQTVMDSLYLYTRLMHKSGQYIEGEYPVSTGTPQQMGSALTYAKRYGWAAMCGITADDDDDANAAEGLPATNAKGQTSGKSKAGSRGDYEVLSAKLREQNSEGDLRVWYGENVDKINALPAEWIDFLREEYGVRMNDLKQGANAKRRKEAKPYGLKEQLAASLEVEGVDEA